MLLWLELGIRIQLYLVISVRELHVNLRPFRSPYGPAAVKIGRRRKGKIGQVYNSETKKLK